MKIKTRIIQIIRWEEKDNYLCNIAWKTEPYDLIVLGIWKVKGEYFSKMGFLSRIFYLARFDARFDSDDILFNDGFSFWQKRPHNFKVNDEIMLDVNVRKIRGG